MPVCGGGSVDRLERLALQVVVEVLKGRLYVLTSEKRGCIGLMVRIDLNGYRAYVSLVGCAYRVLKFAGSVPALQCREEEGTNSRFMLLRG